MCPTWNVFRFSRNLTKVGTSMSLSTVSLIFFKLKICDQQMAIIILGCDTLLEGQRPTYLEQQGSTLESTL